MRWRLAALPASITERMLIGQSAAIQAVRAQIARVARPRSDVLITGETGSGKELVARAIHGERARPRSPRSARKETGDA